MSVDIEIEEGVENEETTTKVAAPAVDVKELARALAQEVNGSRNSNQTQAQRERKLEKVVEEMLGQGVPKVGIEQVLKIINAHNEDREAEYLEESTRAEYDRFNRGLFALAEEAISEYTDKISGGRKLKPGLVGEMSDLVKTDKEFKDLREKIQSGGRPTKAEMAKVAAKAFDDYCAEAGVNRKQPLDLKSSKPKPGAASAFDEAGLDRETRNMYLAIKNKLGAEKAQKYIREHLRG